MKRSRITFSLFFLLTANASMSQNGPQTNPAPSANTYNEVFDKVLTTDRTIPVVEYKGALPKPRAGLKIPAWCLTLSAFRSVLPLGEN